MYAYPYTLEQDDDTILLQFPDIAIAHTFGENEEDAIAHGQGCLTAAISAIMDGKGDIPLPSKPNGRPTIALEPLDAAKVELYRTMRDQGITKAELGRRLGVHAPQVDRLVDLTRTSRFEQLQVALGAVGKTIELRISRRRIAA